jgi:hypothetical protein
VALTNSASIGSFVNVNAALEGLRVTRLVAKGAGIPLTVRVTTAPPVDTSGRSYYYFPNNTHYYEFVTGPSAISWTAARNAAASRELFGMEGYLVTITSLAESTFVATQMNAPNIWIGATDAAAEGASEGEMEVGNWSAPRPVSIPGRWCGFG